MNKILEHFSKITPGFGEVLLCRLGQHSFIIKTGEKLIAVDPYLTADSNRLIPPLIKPEEFSGFDLICCSHDHGDHIDRPALSAIAEASPDSIFLVPEAVKNSITEIPQSRIVGMNDGEFLEIDGVSVKAIAAAHEMLDVTPEGLYPYLGYIIKCNGVSIYHSGDCCVYEGLLTKLKENLPDIMLLPINGRDAFRLKNDCIGNMTWQEAVDLAGWSGTEWVIPAHYDMFEGNLADPQLFLDYVEAKYPGLKTKKLDPGEIFLTGKGMTGKISPEQ